MVRMFLLLEGGPIVCVIKLLIGLSGSYWVGVFVLKQMWNSFAVASTKPGQRRIPLQSTLVFNDFWLNTWTWHVLFCACLCFSLKVLLAQFIFPAHQPHEASHPRVPDRRMQRAGDDRERKTRWHWMHGGSAAQGERTRRMRSRTSYVEDFTSNQLPSPTIARKWISWSARKRISWSKWRIDTVWSWKLLRCRCRWFIGWSALLICQLR